MIWMDSRAQAQANRVVRRLGGERVLMKVLGAVPSGKDVMCKLKWVEEEQPDLYARTHAFLDVKATWSQRATGKFETTRPPRRSPGSGTRRRGAGRLSCAKVLGGVAREMPPVSSSLRGRGRAHGGGRREMGLLRGNAGGERHGRRPRRHVGGGALEHGECAISVGTSGLLLIHSSKPVNLGKFGHGLYRGGGPDDVAAHRRAHHRGRLPEVGHGATRTEEERRKALAKGGLYKELDRVDGDGACRFATSLIFTPWMFGERAPVTDNSLRGGFVNLSMDHTREDMLRAVFEGVAMNFRWCFEVAATKGLPCRPPCAPSGEGRSRTPGCRYSPT